MKRILYILSVVFVFFEGNAQTITNINIQGIDCNNPTGYTVVSTDVPASWFIFKQYDDSTMSFVTIQTGTEDSVALNSCGNVSVQVLNSSFVISDDSTFFVPCPMETYVRAHENIKCFGDSTGMLKEMVTGGIPFDPDGIPDNGDEYYNYSWFKNGILFSSGPNDTILTNLFNGQLNRVPYLVYVEDSTGCIFQPLIDSTGLPDTSFMFQPALIRIDSLVLNSTHCIGTNTGSVVVNIKGGKRFESGNYYNFYLTNTNNDTIRFIDRLGESANVLSDTTPYYVKFDSLDVGNYIMHIVDSSGCILDTIVSVPEPDDYSLHVSIDPTIVCEQDSTWLKIDSISGGHNNLDFSWLGLSPVDSIYVKAGEYSSIILDLDYGCKDTLDYTLTAPNTIYCDVTSSLATCYGTNTGSLVVDSIYGGIVPYSIQWGGINTDSLYAGIYTLFITDSLGCVYIEEHEVFQNPNVDLNEVIYPPSCNGDLDGSISIDISGASPPLNYFWNNASGTPDSVYSLSSGTYYLETTDTLGCLFLDSVVLTQPDILEISFGGFNNPLHCNGTQTLINANITGGTSPFNILWSNSEVSNQVVVSAGNYSIDVTDINGCFATNSILITEPDSLSVSGSVIPATCNLGASASVTYSGGTEPITFIWSNGETTSSASGFTNGDHWVLVTDSCGDTSMYEFTVIVPILETSIYHTNNPDNYAELEVINGEGPYSYQWYDDNMNEILGETSSIIEDLCEAWYFVSTTDANNCEVLDSVYAELYFPLGNIVDLSTTTVHNDNDLWGAEPYTYLWDNGDITAHGNICPGLHRVWVTDVNGCEVVEDVVVEDIILNLIPSDIIIECDITNLDVELEINASGGTGEYSYLWSSGETSNPINVSLNPGLYSVEIIDENLCMIDTAFRIAAFTSDCVPNVFTPNGDDVNDVWLLEDAFFYSDSEVKVYNRYGKLVFKSVGYETPWDGKNQTGNYVEDGAYFYVIDLGDEFDKIKGSVSIIR